MSCEGPTKTTRARMTEVMSILDRHFVINAASVQRILGISRDSAARLLYTMQTQGLIESTDLVKGAYTRPGLTVTRHLTFSAPEPNKDNPND